MASGTGHETEASEARGTAGTTTATATPISAAGSFFQVRRDVAFLNHGSYGACPRPVFETYQRWQRELEQEPVDFLSRRLSGLLAEAREALSRYVGAAAQNLVYVPNATTGMNIIARGVALQPGDEILGNDHEYGAVERTWHYVCARQGATYRKAHLPLPVTTPEALVEQLFAQVNERTRAVVVSHITSPTAIRFPVERIVRRAHELGILAIVDGAHAPGQVELDLDALDADYYTGNCHKWLCAPKGAGFLYVRPEHQQSLEPLVVSWGYNPDTRSEKPLQDYFEWVGTADPAAFLSVPAAIEFQAQHDWPQVRRDAHTLLAQARERIAALTGLPQVTPDSTDWWVQLCAIPIPAQASTTTTELNTRLREEFQVEAPFTEFNGSRFVRVSIQAYNSPQDIDRLVAGLGSLLALQ